MKKIVLSTLFLALLSMAGGANAGFASDWQSIPGTACHPYSNNLANLLQRNHIRLQNPVDSGRSLFVVCPLVRDQGKINTAASAPYGYINIYRQPGGGFDDTYTECYVSQYDAFATATPGGTKTGLYFASTVNVPSIPASTVEDTFFQMPSADHDDGSYTYYSLLCLLKPGMGINSIDFYQE